MLMRTPSQYLSSGNAVYISGQGEPLVIICGGPGLSSRIYQKYLSPLFKSNQLILWDYQGTGASPVHSKFSIETDYQDFVSLVDQIGLNKFSVLAHSYGGMLAVRYASEHPERVSKLILTGTCSSFKSAYPEAFARKKEKLGAEYARYEQILPLLMTKTASSSDLLDFMELEAKFQMHGEPSKDRIAEFLTDTEVSLPTFLSSTDWVAADATASLAKIQAPTLVLTGRYDAPVPPRYSETFREIKDVKFFEFENSGHWAFIDETESFRRRVEEFLKV